MKPTTLAATIILVATTLPPATAAHIDAGDCEWTVPAIVCQAGAAFCTVFTQCHIEVAGCYIGYNPDYGEPFYSGCHDA